MGLLKEGRLRSLWRGAKTLFFLLNMLISLLFLSAPVLLAITDSLVPSLLLSASLSPSPGLSLRSLRSHLSNYDSRRSLVDVPIISIIRSAIILCKSATFNCFSMTRDWSECQNSILAGVYSLCDGPRLFRGPYLGITTALCLMSLGFVSLKASHLFARPGRINVDEIALVACSLSFAVGHIGVAYRTSCRERRKLLLYKIDIEEAVSRTYLDINHHFETQLSLMLKLT